MDKGIADEPYVASTYEQVEAGVTDDAHEMPQGNASSSSSSSTCQGAEDHIYDQPTQLAASSKGAKKPEHTQVSPRQLSSDEVDEPMEIKENMSYLQSREWKLTVQVIWILVNLCSLYIILQLNVEPWQDGIATACILHSYSYICIFRNLYRYLLHNEMSSCFPY